MLNRNIIDVLYNYDYNIMKSNSREYLFFGKQGDNRFQTVIFVDDTRSSSPSASSHKGQTAGDGNDELSDDTSPADKFALLTIKDTLERTLLLKGYDNVEVLFIISTGSPFAYKELADDNIPFWIIDDDAHRIISYGADDGCFTPLRDDMEKRLSPFYKSEPKPLRERFVNIWRQPAFTLIFALINILIFVYMDLFCSYIDQALITLKYSNAWEFILEAGQYYRLFTSMFLHSDMMHLSSNMITLCAIGSQLEVGYGHFKFLLTYILSGLVASITSFAYHCYLGEPVYSVGASGAIFGIFGAYAVFALFNRKSGQPVPAVKIGLVALLMFAGGLTSSYIDNAAHLGGLLAGSIISFICCICSKNKI